LLQEEAEAARGRNDDVHGIAGEVLALNSLFLPTNK
jgi:hypothetical protein